MRHKLLSGKEDTLINTINYMSSQFPPNFIFFGFMPLKDEYFGVSIGDRCYTAVHISSEPIGRVRSDEEDKEYKQIQSGKKWLAVFYGSDNSSCMKRFDTKERMIKWLHDKEELVRDNTWLWYNS